MTYEEAIKQLNSYINNEVYTNKHQESCRMAIRALKRQIPMKVVDIQEPVVKWGRCPVCKGELNKLGNMPTRVFASQKYCSDCGQALDWSEE